MLIILQKIFKFDMEKKDEQRISRVIHEAGANFF